MTHLEMRRLLVALVAAFASFGVGAVSAEARTRFLWNYPLATQIAAYPAELDATVQHASVELLPRKGRTLVMFSRLDCGAPCRDALGRAVAAIEGRAAESEHYAGTDPRIASILAREKPMPKQAMWFRVGDIQKLRRTVEGGIEIIDIPARGAGLAGDLMFMGLGSDPCLGIVTPGWALQYVDCTSDPALLSYFDLVVGGGTAMAELAAGSLGKLVHSGGSETSFEALYTLYGRGGIIDGTVPKRLRADLSFIASIAQLPVAGRERVPEVAVDARQYPDYVAPQQRPAFPYYRLKLAGFAEAAAWVADPDNCRTPAEMMRNCWRARAGMFVHTHPHAHGFSSADIAVAAHTLELALNSTTNGSVYLAVPTYDSIPWGRGLVKVPRGAQTNRLFLFADRFRGQPGFESPEAANMDMDTRVAAALMDVRLFAYDFQARAFVPLPAPPAATDAKLMALMQQPALRLADLTPHERALVFTLAKTLGRTVTAETDIDGIVAEGFQRALLYGSFPDTIFYKGHAPGAPFLQLESEAGQQAPLFMSSGTLVGERLEKRTAEFVADRSFGPEGPAWRKVTHDEVSALAERQRAWFAERAVSLPPRFASRNE